MRNPSPKARYYIEAGIDLLQNRAALEMWKQWAGDHPFKRSEGFLNQEQEYLPNPVAHVVSDGLRALSKKIAHNLETDRSLSREAAISLRNALSYIKDIETEIFEDLRERV